MIEYKAVAATDAIKQIDAILKGKGRGIESTNGKITYFQTDDTKLTAQELADIDAVIKANNPTITKV